MTRRIGNSAAYIMDVLNRVIESYSGRERRWIMTMTIGQRAKVFREQQGMTQPEAAELAGISQATWSRIETGQKTPTAGEVLGLSWALGVPFDTMRGESEIRDRAKFAARTSASISAADAEWALAIKEEMILLAEYSAELTKACYLAPRKPHAVNAFDVDDDAASPAAHAAAFRSRHGLGDAPIRDIIQVAEDFCGAFVFSRAFPDPYEAFTLQDEAHHSTIIAVGTSDHYERQRFSIAHELGHLTSGVLSSHLHSMPGYERTPAETGADEFARHLLVPGTGLESLLGESGEAKGQLNTESLSDVVRVFGVSPQAAMIQLKQYGWITAAQNNAWWNDPTISGRGLALRYGWASERNAMVRAAQTPRRPTQLVEATTSAFTDGAATFEALALVSGRSDRASLATELHESGIVQVSRVEVAEIEDLSDLYRGQE